MQPNIKTGTPLLLIIALTLLAALTSTEARAQTNGTWSDWTPDTGNTNDTRNYTQKNQIRTCNAPVGTTTGRCCEIIDFGISRNFSCRSGVTVPHETTRTRPNKLFWETYLENGPYPQRNATETATGHDVINSNLSSNQDNDGRLLLSGIDGIRPPADGLSENFRPSIAITATTPTPTSGVLFPLPRGLAIRLKAGTTTPTTPTTPISGRIMDIDASGGAPNQQDGLMIARYLLGIRTQAGLIDGITGNPNYSEIRARLDALFLLQQ